MNKEIPLDFEKEKLMKSDPSSLLLYLKDITLHLMDFFENEENEEIPNHYELEIQKLEAEVRQHIRVFLMKKMKPFKILKG